MRHCGLVDVRVIDTDGIYDPGKPNDRLLLGMKDNISDVRASVIRVRMYEAAQQNASGANCG